jgi:hypothetical protein
MGVAAVHSEMLCHFNVAFTIFLGVAVDVSGNACLGGGACNSEAENTHGLSMMQNSLAAAKIVTNEFRTLGVK